MSGWRQFIHVVRDNPLYVYLAMGLALGFALIVAALLVTM
jgi:hypothetical protein